MDEREWFRLLQSVQGVGTKVALAILSTLSTAEIGNAVALQDKAMIGRANGVGKKLAERIVLELKDKTPAFAPLSQDVSEACRRARCAAAHRGGRCRLGARQPRLWPGAGGCRRLRRHAQGGR